MKYVRVCVLCECICEGFGLDTRNSDSFAATSNRSKRGFRDDETIPGPGFQECKWHPNLDAEVGRDFAGCAEMLKRERKNGGQMSRIIITPDSVASARYAGRP